MSSLRHAHINQPASTLPKAMDKSFSMEESSKPRLDSLKNIKKAYNSAKNEMARFGESFSMVFLISMRIVTKAYDMQLILLLENEEQNAAADNVIFMNEAYAKCCGDFQRRSRDRRRPLQVLDIFSGIGSGAVAL